MGTITSGVGLVSGLNHTDLVKQMLAVEARPRDLLLQRIGTINAQRTAYMDISARVTALLTNVSFLKRGTSFRNTKATSSSADTLTAKSSLGTPPGSYQFIVRALAATHQLVSRGFASRTAPLPAGQVTIESAQAQANRSTELSALNGFAGVQRGSFKVINDGTGQQATISTTDAVTLADVVTAINDAAIGVTATVEDDRLVLRNASGGGAVRVTEVGTGQVAADLGFGPGNTVGAGGTLTGTALTHLSTSVPLSALNDGLGIRHGVAGGDFTIQLGDDGTGPVIGFNMSDNITDTTLIQQLNHGQGVRLGTVRISSINGAEAVVDLTGSKTVGELKQRLTAAFGDGRITVTLNGSRLIVADGYSLQDEDTEQKFKLEDVTGHSIVDLGLDQEASNHQVRGREILHLDTLADVLAAINYAAGNDDGNGNPLISATIAADGQRLVLQNSGGLALTLAAGAHSQALTDLGFAAGTYTDAQLTGQRILSGVNTVLLKTLRGGQGVPAGALTLTVDGQDAAIDLTGAETLAQAVQRINAAGQALGVHAGLDVNGTRVVLKPTGTGTPSIALAGEFATALGFATSGATLRSADVQRQYIAETTATSSLNNGRGIGRGTFTIKNSLGQLVTVRLSAGNTDTLADILDAINSAATLADADITARINDTGDGLLITDSSGGAGPLEIADASGTSARDLNIAGTSTTGSLDGSLAFTFTVEAGESLETFAARISARNTLVSATVLNDGTGVAPYRLRLVSRAGGTAGALLIDNHEEGGQTGLGVTTLTQARDARLVLGSDASGALITSAENTLRDVVPGLDITAQKVDDKAVTVTVASEIDSIVQAMKTLADNYNNAINRAREVVKYDQETQKAGVLLGENTVRSVEDRLRRAFGQRILSTGTSITRLSDVGLKIENGTMSFDETKFREQIEQNPAAVEAFFTTENTGIAYTLETAIKSVTDPDGLIDRRTDTLDSRKEVLNDRVVRLNELLQRKEARLTREFQAMETALSLLQSQQVAISNLSALLASGTTSTARTS